MRNLLIGLLLGISLTAGVGVIASSRQDPKITGDDGVLKGVEVLDRQGKRVCQDPWFSKDGAIISCG